MAAETIVMEYSDTYCKTIQDLNLVLNSIIFVQDMNETTLTENTFTSLIDHIAQYSFGKLLFSGSGSDGTCVYKSTPGKVANHLADFCHYDIDFMYEVQNFKAYEELLYPGFRTMIDDKNYINFLIYPGEGEYSQFLRVGNPMHNCYISSSKCIWKLWEIYSKAMVDVDCYCLGIYSKNKYGNICSPCIERNEQYLNHTFGKAKIWAEQVHISGPCMKEVVYIENKLSSDGESIVFDDRFEYEPGECMSNPPSKPRKSRTAKNIEKQRQNRDIVQINEDDFLSSERKIHIGIDHVPAIHCPFWPIMANGFLFRIRRYDWPSKSLVREILHSGVYIVAKSYNKAKTLFKQSFYAHCSCMDFMMWRYSFSIAETQLTRTFSRCQIRCLLLAKSLVKGILKHLDSYHYKTVMFCLCEQYPVKDWDEDQFAELFLLYLRLLGKFIEEKNIPHFFIQDFNLFEDTTEEEFLELSTAFQNFFANITQAIVSKLQGEPFDDMWQKYQVIWFSTYKCLSKLTSHEEKIKKIAFAKHFLLLSNFLKKHGNFYGKGMNQRNSTLYNKMAKRLLNEYPDLNFMDDESLFNHLNVQDIWIKYEVEKLHNVKTKPTESEEEQILKLLGDNVQIVGRLKDKIT